MEASQLPPQGLAPADRRAAELRLASVLGTALGTTLEVRLGRSRTQPVQTERQGSRWRVRLHEAFAEAEESALTALAGWLRSGQRARRASRELDAWLQERVWSQPAPRVRRERPGSPAGRCHDLEELAEDLWHGFLAGGLEGERRPRLEWGPRRRSRSRGGLRLGSWDPITNRVRLHAVLDSDEVPAWFIRAVLVHELLHALHPPVRDARGHWRPHHARFRAAERAWPDHDRAREYERLHIAGWVRRARALGDEA
ncbi:MAG: hypothetical protein ISQ08_00390 [Planctomycetes bacterium]|nr:hypothetical protein [Planctomycetota bacterium]